MYLCLCMHVRNVRAFVLRQRGPDQELQLMFKWSERISRQKRSVREVGKSCQVPVKTFLNAATPPTSREEPQAPESARFQRIDTCEAPDILKCSIVQDNCQAFHLPVRRSGLVVDWPNISW